MSRSGSPGGDRGKDVIRASSQYLGHGLAFAGSVALFGWLGSWIGARIGAEALLTLAGMLLGGAAAFYSIYAQLVIRPREEAEREREEAG